MLRGLLKSWIDFLYPPLCRMCKEPDETAYFCSGCWEECALPDPAGRCRHCFEEMEEEICPRCKRKEQLFAPRAYAFERTPAAFHLMASADPESLAAFLIIQWERLDWPMPDAVIPFPKEQALARSSASLLGCFYADVLTEWRGEWKCDPEVLEEDAVLLLVGSRPKLEEAKGAAEALLDAFPKKAFCFNVDGFGSHI